MPLDASTLITTVGGSTSNSYVSLAEFATYCEQRLNTEAFDDSSPDDKIRALLWSTRRLGLENWLGTRASSTQALAWPRVDVQKIDSAGYAYGAYREIYLSTEIPQQIKDAQMEFALAYLDGFDDGEEDQIDAFSADGVSVKFRQGRLLGSLPVAVIKLLSGLVQSTRLVRA